MLGPVTDWPQKINIGKVRRELLNLALQSFIENLILSKTMTQLNDITKTQLNFLDPLEEKISTDLASG